jgi:hypothetical protein
MRSIAYVLVAVLSGCAATPSSTSEVRPASGSSVATSTARDIGGGALIQLPPGWTFNSYYMPPDLNATNVRITSHGIRMAITGMLKSGPMRTTAELTSFLSQGTASYIPLSKERAFHPVAVETPTTRLVYATFSAANQGQGIPALVNEHSLQVTSAILNKEGVIFTVTISVNQSDNESSKNHLLAIESLKNVK